MDSPEFQLERCWKGRKRLAPAPGTGAGGWAMEGEQMEGLGGGASMQGGAAQISVRQHTWGEFLVWRGDLLERDHR